MWSVTKLTATALGAALLLLGLVACRNEAQSAEGGGASLTITAPTEGESVTSPVDLTVQVSGTEIGPTSSGNDHFHVYVGDNYEVVTSTQSQVDLPGGEQTIRVVLAQANHEETDVSDSVTVDVTGGGTTGTDQGGYKYGGGGD